MIDFPARFDVESQRTFILKGRIQIDKIAHTGLGLSSLNLDGLFEGIVNQ